MPLCILCILCYLNKVLIKTLAVRLKLLINPPTHTHLQAQTHARTHSQAQKHAHARTHTHTHAHTSVSKHALNTMQVYGPDIVLEQ